VRFSLKTWRLVASNFYEFPGSQLAKIRVFIG